LCYKVGDYKSVLERIFMIDFDKLSIDEYFVNDEYTADHYKE